jgi:menaquinone-specific isochorismate synthase
VTTILKKELVSLSDAASVLKQRVAAISSFDHSMTVTVQIPLCDSLTWLEAQSYGGKIYWATPDGKTEIAGSGVADLVRTDSIETLDEFQAELSELAPISSWYFGGIRFDGGEGSFDASWAPFAGASFVRPRFVLVRQGDKMSITCHLMKRDDLDQVSAEIDDLSFPEIKVADQRVPLVTGRELTPDLQGWTDQVEEILAGIKEGKATKQVLARKVDLRLNGTMSPFLLLRKMQKQAPGCFSFLIGSGTDSVFLGTSPELLYTRDGDEVRSEAVAATCPAGKHSAESDDLAREMLSDEKQQREHKIVAEFIQDTLEGLCTEVSADAKASVLRRGDWQHLYKQFEATLQPGVSDLRLVKELSPTPAVAGREPAVIRALEGFDRGYYAGPVGWFSPGAAEFAVGIRSALLNDSHVTLFSGSGIVEGSTPDQEWQETEVKLRAFLEIFDR